MKVVYDRFITGFIAALILPLIGIYIYYLLFFSYMGLSSFINFIINHNFLISVISLGAILNLVLFFLFYQFEKDYSAKGVIGATLIYAFVVLFFKIIYNEFSF